MELEKRVDLRLISGYRIRGKRFVRGKAVVTNDGAVIIYEGITCNTWEDLIKAIPNLRAVVTGDKVLKQHLLEAGFKVEDVDKKHGSLHVTVDTRLLDLLDDESEKLGVKTSWLVTKILNEHYGTNY